MIGWRRGIFISSDLLFIGWVAVVFLIVLPTAAPAGEPVDWVDRQIALSGLTEDHRRILDETIDEIRRIKPKELRIDSGIYARLTRFEIRFGLPLDGEALADWILARFRRIAYQNSRLAALNQNQGDLLVGDLFFQDLAPLDRMYLLVHEARHSDGDGHPHVRCPKDFPFISAAQPRLDLQEEQACDDSADGAYGLQAAFLFELFAYGILDSDRAGLLYNSSVARILQSD